MHPSRFGEALVESSIALRPRAAGAARRVFFLNDPATPETSPLPQPAALPILVAPQVPLDIAEGIATLLFRGRLRPPKNSLPASQQFPDRKGLVDVVVAPELEASNLSTSWP